MIALTWPKNELFSNTERSCVDPFSDRTVQRKSVPIHFKVYATSALTTGITLFTTF
ncbi:MAG: hypothetical protein M3R08_03320 [Bacteroidota bacterium]|nr:hypothetical protein [Bacteroidota bacterium]